MVAAGAAVLPRTRRHRRVRPGQPVTGVAFVAPVLVCYDGSDGARAALEAAVQVFSRPMVVACYWQPFGESDKPLNIEILELVQDPSEHQRARAGAGDARRRRRAPASQRPRAPTADPVAVKVTAPVDEAILAPRRRAGRVRDRAGLAEPLGAGLDPPGRHGRRRGAALQQARVRHPVLGACRAAPGRPHAREQSARLTPCEPWYLRREASWPQPSLTPPRPSRDGAPSSSRSPWSPCWRASSSATTRGSSPARSR